MSVIKTTPQGTTELGAPAQAPAAALLVRPHHFRPNPETAADNRFQREVGTHGSAAAAAAEVDAVAAALDLAGVRVNVFDDTTTLTPDSVFPNNWFSTHHDGTVVLYPMHARNRRAERRSDVLALLESEYTVSRLVDLTAAEADDRALEGTGSLVLDHRAKVAYMTRSRRTDSGVLAEWCRELGYRALAFDASDRNQPIYHTNVLMSVGTDYVVAGLDCIDSAADRKALEAAVDETGKTLIPINRAEVRSFVGNCLEVSGTTGQRTLVMSARARAGLRIETRDAIERFVPIAAVSIPSLELAGGSVRCMIAGIHLQSKGAGLPVPPQLHLRV